MKVLKTNYSLQMLIWLLQMWLTMEIAHISITLNPMTSLLFRFHPRTTSVSFSVYPGASNEVKSLSRVRLFATPWTVAYQASPSRGFSRQEYWSGLPSSAAGDLPDPGIKYGFPELQADSLPSEPPGKPVIYE